MSEVLTLYQKILIVKWYYKSDDEVAKVLALFEEYFKFSPILAVFNQVIKAFELTGSVVDDVICAIKEEPATDAYHEILYIEEENEDNFYFERNPDVCMEEEPVEEELTEELVEEDQTGPGIDEPELESRTRHNPSKVPNQISSNSRLRGRICRPGHAIQSVLPEKSKDRYELVYEKFQEWKRTHEIQQTNEDVLLRYFEGPLKKLAGNTIWSIYSMLKSTIYLNESNKDVARYFKLRAVLERRQSQSITKKSKILTVANVEQFWKLADDRQYLLIKVASIMGLVGALRKQEMTDFSIDDIEDHADGIKIRVPNSKANNCREFLLSNNPFRGIDLVNIVNRYRSLRPSRTKHKRFFIGYRQGKCTVQPVGVNTFASMPKQIAEFLNLPSPNLYTGHCFRRSSFLMQSGLDKPIPRGMSLRVDNVETARAAVRKIAASTTGEPGRSKQ